MRVFIGNLLVKAISIFLQWTENNEYLKNDFI